MKRKISGQADSEVTRFKAFWRTKATPDDKDWFFALWDQPGISTAKHRDAIRKRWRFNLLHDSQLSGDGALRDWCWQERLEDLELARQQAEEEREQELHPDWTKEQIREAMLRKIYRRAQFSGDWKLALATVKQDAALETLNVDRARLGLLEKKAAQADTARQVVNSRELTDDEKQARIKELFGIQ